MKTKILLLLVSAFFYGCSNDNSSNNQDLEQKAKNEEVILDEIPINLKSLNIGSQITLFTYANVSEAADAADAAMVELIREAKDDLADESGATHLFTNVKIANGKAYVSDILYYDANKDEFIGGHYYDDVTDTYEPYGIFPSPQTVSAFVNGRCPNGYTQLASCGNFNNPEDCISNAMKSYLSANLSSMGDCVDVRVSVGLSKTRVCGRQC